MDSSGCVLWHDERFLEKGCAEGAITRCDVEVGEDVDICCCVRMAAEDLHLLPSSDRRKCSSYHLPV